MQESAKHDATRFIGTTRQDWTLAPRTWLRVDMTGVSDDNMLRDYGDDLYQRSSQRVESNVFLTRSWDAWNLVGDMFFYQDLTTRRPVELNRLPDIRLVGTPQPLHDVPGVLWQFEGSAIRFVRDVGSDGGRVDIHPRVSRPVPLDVLTLTPFVGGRLTAYDRTVTGFHTSPGITGTIEETNDHTRLRRLFEAGGGVPSQGPPPVTTGRPRGLPGGAPARLGQLRRRQGCPGEDQFSAAGFRREPGGGPHARGQHKWDPLPPDVPREPPRLRPALAVLGAEHRVHQPRPSR